MNWYVYDPDPIDADGPVLYGPFGRKSDAEEFANEQHPDDESGNTVVLTLTAVL